MVRHHPGAPRAGSPIRRLPSWGGDLLRGKRAPVGGESCGYRNGLHETTMALLYTRGIKGAPAIACRRGVIGNHAEKGRHLLSVQVRILPSAPLPKGGRKKEVKMKGGMDTVDTVDADRMDDTAWDPDGETWRPSG